MIGARRPPVPVAPQCERIFEFPAGDVRCTRPATAYVTLSAGTKPAVRITSKLCCAKCALAAANVGFAFGCTVSMASITAGPVPVPVAS